MTDRCCGDCKFWQQFTAPLASDLGECRRHSPAPYISTVREIGRMIGLLALAIEKQADIEQGDVDYALENGPGMTFWPETAVEDWCGDFEPKR